MDLSEVCGKIQEEARTISEVKAEIRGRLYKVIFGVAEFYNSIGC